ncbi:hypothetical protein B0H10DRAFT_2195521, partial [Mycena sp. CBHHK59/15]
PHARDSFLVRVFHPRRCARLKLNVSNLRPDDDDVNDGSDSDDSEPNYQPRAGLRGVHHIPDESLTVTSDGRTRAKLTSVATPASPAKKSQISLNTDIHVPREPERRPQKEWQANYSEFDAEYGPGLNKGPREQRGS